VCAHTFAHFLRHVTGRWSPKHAFLDLIEHTVSLCKAFRSDGIQIQQILPIAFYMIKLKVGSVTISHNYSILAGQRHTPRTLVQSKTLWRLNLIHSTSDIYLHNHNVTGCGGHQPTIMKWP
jgi:hypothetical protein